MITHHPDVNMLVEYTNGSLPWALSLAVKAHIQLCPHCRQHAAQMNVLGGIQLADTIEEAVTEEGFERLIARIKNASPQPISTATPATVSATSALFCRSPLPAIIEKLLPDKLRWKKISGALSMSRLTTGQKEFEVAFHKILKGGKVVEHDHHGLEVTLVLDGSFSDENGIYQPGDFLVLEPGHIHRPTAAVNQDCLCLSISAAPIKITGMIGNFINPFLSIKPA